MFWEGPETKTWRGKFTHNFVSLRIPPGEPNEYGLLAVVLLPQGGRTRYHVFSGEQWRWETAAEPAPTPLFVADTLEAAQAWATTTASLGLLNGSDDGDL